MRGIHWDRYIVLAPVLVVAGGLLIGIGILLVRAFMFTVRESGYSRWIYIGLVGLAGAIAVLTYLGVSLPKE